jgi:hypothetical protein
MTEIEKRIPHGVTVPIYRHSGSMIPAPKSKSDGNAGGEIPRSQFADKANAVDKDRA